MASSDEIRKLLVEVEQAAGPSGGEITDSTRAQLLAASRKLTAALEDPEEQVWRLTLLPTIHSCALVAWQCRLLGPWPKEIMTTSELAAHLKVDELLVARLIRALLHFGLFGEVDEDTYEHNALSTRLSTPPSSISAFQIADKIRQISSIPEYFAEHGYENPGSNPNQPSVFQWMHKTDKEFFQWMISQPDKNELNKFNQTMSLSLDARHYHKRTHFLDLYPFEAELKDASPEEVAVVDVGGGYGHLLREVRKHLPQMMGKLVLEDLAETVEGAGGVVPTENVDVQPYNFFTQEQPVIGARMYVFRHVLTDWSDHECRKILRNTIPALVKGTSRILLVELVLPPKNPPLWGSLMDINMMKYSGMVRTERQWRGLVESTGLRLEKVWYGGKGDSVIEVVLN